MSKELDELQFSKYKRKASEMLQMAKERVYQYSLSDMEEDTILLSLNRENDEAHTHSNILFWLMTRPCKKDRSDSFLLLLLKELKIPSAFCDDKWTPYRERHFGDGRIDFVLESPRFVVCIEMKISAGDGRKQIERYESFCKSRRKEYLIYYLTPFGNKPSEQSVGKADTSKLRCISFQNEILSWLEKCLTHTETGGYKYSYIKQYIGTVHRIADCEGGKVGVNDIDNLIADTESAKAALFIMDEFKRRITELLNDFFSSLAAYLKKDNSRYDFEVWEEEGNEYLYSKKNTYPGITSVLDTVKVGRKEYQIIFYVELEDYMYSGFIFHLVDKNTKTSISLEEAKKRVPEFYKKWSNAIGKAKIENLKHGTSSFWFPIENTNGERFYFKEFSDSVLEMIDDLCVQVEYIGDYLSKQVIQKVTKNVNVRHS